MQPMWDIIIALQQFSISNQYGIHKNNVFLTNDQIEFSPSIAFFLL